MDQRLERSVQLLNGHLLLCFLVNSRAGDDMKKIQDAKLEE